MQDQSMSGQPRAGNLNVSGGKESNIGATIGADPNKDFKGKDVPTEGQVKQRQTKKMHKGGKFPHL